MRSQWKLLIFVLVAGMIAMAGTPVCAAGPEEPKGMKVEARSAVLIESSTGEIILEQNSREMLPPASVTKVMTLLILMEHLEKGVIKLEEKVSVSPDAARMGGSQIWLEPGEEMTVGELLKAIAIVSANDACYALAEKVAGSEEAFVAMMNKRAKELNLTSTSFVNCTGLSPDDPSVRGNMTSARDVAVMSFELLKHPAVLQWTGTWIDHLRGGASFLRNTNKLVRFYEGCDGLKTGFTNEAGFCLSATAKRNHVRLVAVVMNSPSADIRAREISRMFNYGFAQFEAFPIAKQGETLAEVPIRHGIQDSVQAGAAEDFFLPVRRGSQPSYTKHFVLKAKKLEAPLKKGDPVGVLEIRSGEQVLGKVNLVACADIEKARFSQLVSKVARKLFGELFGKPGEK